MIDLSKYIDELNSIFPECTTMLPWKIVSQIPALIEKQISKLPNDFKIQGNIAIHKSAIIEEHAILKGPLIISQDCFIAAHAYLRSGVFLGTGVKLGPGCEVKSTFLFSGSALAHLNYVGDSLIGSGVNLEGGSVIANCYNERTVKEIEVLIDGERIKTGCEKFGALVGDNTKIGANAVLSPGTILKPDSVVGRLELVEQ